MEGQFFKYIKCGIGLLAILASLFSDITLSVASTPLESLEDNLNSNSLNQPNVQHDISFTLPVAGLQLSPTDYILIDLPGYNNITPPIAVYGGFGTPNITMSGAHRVSITNLAGLPGNELRILGLIATNPGSQSGFGVTVSITPDSSGVTIRSQSTVQANQGGPFISVAATVESPYAALNLTGFTAPSGFVTLTENGTVIATTLAGGDGSFVLSVTGLPPQQHDFRISATDYNSLTTSITTVELFTLAQTLTSVSNILLSPTLQLDKATIHPGDTLTASGSAKPNSTINLFVESSLRTYSLTTDNNGAWSYTIPSTETTNYLPGQYRAYASVQDDDGNQSIVSNTLNFTVELASTDDNPAPACDISQGDLNCDGNTNLTDFSILLFYWHTNRKAGDINSDGSVDLIDFSIMMFYFRR